MTLKEINEKAGSIFNYLGYLLLLFGWNVVNDTYALLVPASSWVANAAVSWGLALLVGPIVFSIFYAGIHDRQTNEDDFERESIFSHIKRYFFRFLGAYLLWFMLYYLVLIVVMLIPGAAALRINANNLFSAILTALSSTVLLFWFSALAVEPKLLRSLGHVLKTMLRSPLALGIAIFVLCVYTADNVAFDSTKAQVPLLINLARAAVFAVLKTFAVMYILVLYKKDWGALIQRQQADAILIGRTRTRPGDGLARVSLGLTFFSFVPFVHLGALILGLVSLKRAQRFILKAAIACCVGGFFTLLYALLLVGHFASPPVSTRLPDYSFLAQGNPAIQPAVDLLYEGTLEDVEAQVGGAAEDPAQRDWSVDTVLALAKYNDNDLNGALKDFYSALQKKPLRSEFYLYYGLALLDNKNTDMAKEQFQLALEHQPKLKVTQQYYSLVQNLYEPDRINSAFMVLVILFFLFTVHEYGHTFAAWKLGDDTAKNQGRLTLNPVAHLNIFGSILLPAILLLQQSGVFFGWARPVPVDPRNFKNPEKDHMLVSFAGPAVNLLVALVAMLLLVALALVTRLLWPESLSLNLVDPFSATSLIGSPYAKGLLLVIVFLKQLFYTSLILGFFNLLPIPPLDGAWILQGILPEKFRVAFDFARRFGFMIFILFTMTPVFDFILGVPIGIAWLGLRWAVSLLGFA
jgi:Zn-dependent protease